MASVINEISLGGQAGMVIKGNWLNSFDNMTLSLPTISKKALNTAGFILKESVKQSFASKMPAAARPFKVPATTKGGYVINRPDLLIDAARQSSADESHVTVFMGGNEPNSPLFIARMYNKDSVDRYARTKKGVKLAKKKFLGHTTGVNYWDPGITQGQAAAMQVMETILGNNLEKQFIK